MITLTPTHATAPDAPPPAAPEEQLWKQEADRAFEAAVRWFLAVSAAA